MTTTIETEKVQERRRLRFRSVAELRAEIERILAAEQAGTLRRSGNWTTGQVFGHLAAWINYGYEGYRMRVPWFIRPFIRRKLAGCEDGNRQMVDILTAVLTDGLSAVEAACAEALAEGVHSADVILNILARRRDPGPPITILTPDALRLRHAPIADCARYDRLRRA